VLRLADGKNVIIHEASDPLQSQSSTAQTGKSAVQAEVGVLYLIHYPAGQITPGDLLSEAWKHFQGPAMLAEDFTTMEY
jgi:ribonuclease BN (tRNA processing enzyme)